MGEMQWLRLKVGVNLPLRRGAWYPVEAVTRQDAVVMVEGNPVHVPLEVVELRSTPPQEWTIVRPEVEAPKAPESLRSGYVVCPKCRARAVLPFARVIRVQCPGCKEVFTMLWGDREFEAD